MLIQHLSLTMKTTGILKLMLTHQGVREWMSDEGIILIRTPQGLEFMDEYEAHPFQALFVSDHSVEELHLLIQEYINS